MGASIELMLEVGQARIERRVRELACEARSILRRCGGRLLSDEAPYHESPIVTACFPRIDASGLARELKARGVLVSARHGWLRVSPHFYNDECDLARLEGALREIL
jgi:selenocysteine lyase/cysteine desulfurase